MFAEMLGAKKPEGAGPTIPRRRAEPLPDRPNVSALDALEVQKLVVEEMAAEKAALEESCDSLEAEMDAARAEISAFRAAITARECERFWYDARIGS